MPRFRCAVDDNDRATELPLFRVCGSVEENPHMRAFWASIISFHLAFLGWFALTPLAMPVATSMGICENQLYPPSEYPKEQAYLNYKNLHNGLTYCRYGVVRGPNGKAIDCEGPNTTDHVGSNLSIYRPEELASCVCTSGTECRRVISQGNLAAVASTILLRISMGTLLERYGPVNTQCSLLLFGAIWLAMSAAITAPWNYTLFRFFIGMVGAAFVTNQFWCSLMFAPNVIGTANATAAGWGNMGGGVSQIFMTAILFQPLVDSGMSDDTAWRVSMFVPASFYILCAVCLKYLCWDMPRGRHYDPVITGKKEQPSLWDHWDVLKDFRVVVMIFQYSACFGTELVMNNSLTTHFTSYFQLGMTEASLLASSFGLMNIFARSAGGILSDLMYRSFGFPGRIWAQFLSLFLEAIFLFGFGCVDNSNPWFVALAVLVGFSLFVQMAEGTSYGMVPFLKKEQLAVVSALVGAGGNLGAVIATALFYDLIEDDLLPYRVHSGYVMFWALLSPVYYWSDKGGMFCAKQSSEPTSPEPQLDAL